MAKNVGNNMRLLGIAGGLALLTVAWRFPVPMYPEPTTLLSLVAVLLGILIGWRDALIITTLYILATIFGLPAMLWGSLPALRPFLDVVTSGYALGLAIGAVVAAQIAAPAKGSNLRVAMAALGGHAVYLACGIVWMMRFMTWHAALAEGLYPFLVPTLAKSALAFLLAILLRRFF